MAHLANYTCERCGGTGQQEAGMPCPLDWGYSDSAGTCDRCKGLGILGSVTVAQDVPLVEEIHLLAEDALCVVYRIYTSERYPEILTTSSSTIMMCPSGAARSRADLLKEKSVITFSDAQSIILQTARHGVIVVAFKQVVDLQEARPVWRCPQEGDRQGEQHNVADR